MDKRHIFMTFLITGLLMLILCILHTNNKKLAKVESNESEWAVQAVENLLSDEYDENNEEDNYDEILIDLPETLASIIVGASWSGENFCTAGGKTFYLAEDEYMLTSALCTSEKVLIEDPSFDYVHRGSDDEPFLITVGEKSIIVNFSDPKSIKQLMSLNFAILSGFKRQQWRNVADFSDRVLCPLEIDIPGSSVANKQFISRWVANYALARYSGHKRVAVSSPTYFTNVWKNNSTYKGSLNDWNAINEYISENYYDYIVRENGKDDKNYPTGRYSCLSLRARYYTDHYVTYQMTERGYGGGTHGWSNVELVTYDHENHQEVDWKYLFKPGCEEQVLKLFEKAAETDEQFQYYSANFWSGVQIFKEDGTPSGEILLPQPALTLTGVVISMQLYDSVGYSSGSFHLTVPYNNLKQYLTDHAKHCIGLK